VLQHRASCLPPSIDFNLARRQKDKNNSTIVDPLLVLVRPTSTTSSSSYCRSSVVLVFECCWDAGFTSASWSRSLIFGRGGGYQCTGIPLPSQGSKMLTYYKKICRALAWNTLPSVGIVRLEISWPSQSGCNILSSGFYNMLRIDLSFLNISPLFLLCLSVSFYDSSPSSQTYTTTIL